MQKSINNTDDFINESALKSCPEKTNGAKTNTFFTQ